MIGSPTLRKIVVGLRSSSGASMPVQPLILMTKTLDDFQNSRHFGAARLKLLLVISKNRQKLTCNIQDFWN